MIRFYILILFLFSCTDLLINNLEYHSVELKGNAWIEINQGTNFNANDFPMPELAPVIHIFFII